MFSVRVGVAQGRANWCQAGLIYVLTDLPDSHDESNGESGVWRYNAIIYRLLDIELTRIITRRYRQMGVLRYYLNFFIWTLKLF